MTISEISKQKRKHEDITHTISCIHQWTGKVFLFPIFLLKTVFSHTMSSKVNHKTLYVHHSYVWNLAATPLAPFQPSTKIAFTAGLTEGKPIRNCASETNLGRWECKQKPWEIIQVAWILIQSWILNKIGRYFFNINTILFIWNLTYLLKICVQCFVGRLGAIESGMRKRKKRADGNLKLSGRNFAGLHCCESRWLATPKKVA